MTNLKTYSVYEIGRCDNWTKSEAFEKLKRLNDRQANDIHEAVKDFALSPSIYNSHSNYHFDNESMVFYADLQLISGHYIITEEPRQGI